VTGGITNNSANVETVDMPITLTGTNAFFSGVGNLVLAGGTTGSGQMNVAAGAGGVTMLGTVSYTGSTFIANGSSLIMGASSQWQNPTSFAAIYSGAMIDNGTFVYNSTETYGTNAGVISGNGGLIVNTTGTLVLNNSGSSFTNNIVINGGILSDVAGVNNTTNTALGANNVVGRTITINNGGILSLDNSGGNDFSGGTGPSQIVLVVNQGGLVRQTSGNAWVTNVLLNGGTMLATAVANAGATWPEWNLGGSIIVGGTSPSTMSAAAAGTTTSGVGYSLGTGAAAGYQTPFVVASTGSSGPDLIVSGSLYNTDSSPGNATGFIKSGNGTMLLSGTNLFQGPITVSAGTVILGGAGELTANATNSAGNLIINYPGNITISSGGTFTFGSSQFQTNSGVISGAGTLMVTGTPGLVLSNAASTLTGNVVITNGGTLFLIAGAKFVGPSTISIAGGATYDVSAIASPYVWPAGSSVTGSGAAGSAATINSAGAVTIGSSSSIILNNYDGTDPGLTINGSLALGGANAFVVNGAPLANGQYNLIYASGGITDPAGYPAVTGTAIGPASQGSISVSGNNVVLTVSSVNVNAPPIQFSLSGKVLTLSWPTNSGWTLQSNSINVAVPGDWFSIPGSSSATTFPINITTAKTNVFYRLYLP
jgi:fibronectin-binding autotransporter adhesin